MAEGFEALHRELPIRKVLVGREIAEKSIHVERARSAQHGYDRVGLRRDGDIGMRVQHRPEHGGSRPFVTQNEDERIVRT